MIAHISTFLGTVVSLGNIIAPLAIWLGQRKYSAFVEENARESVNFQISVTLYLLAANIVLRPIAQSLTLAIVLYVVYSVLAAAWKAHHGKMHHYALSIRFLR